MKIIVQGGTRSTSQKTLCDNCTNATIIRGMSESQQIIKCSEISRVINFNVEQCSSYNRFGVMSLYEMKGMATIVELRKDGVGFYSADKWAEKTGKPILPPEYEGG